MPEVPKSSLRVIEQHPWPCVAHDLAYSFLHFRLVAMDRAKAAGRLVFTKTAMGQAGVGIRQELLTGRTQLSVSFFAAAREADQQFHGLFFLSDTSLLFF